MRCTMHDIIIFVRLTVKMFLLLRQATKQLSANTVNSSSHFKIKDVHHFTEPLVHSSPLRNFPNRIRKNHLENYGR